MEKPKESFGVEIRVGKDGTAVLPASLLRQLRATPGSNVRVMATSQSLSRELIQRGVTEDEIGRIGSLQFESRMNVVSFLSSEGVLSADKDFRRKMKRVGR